ncbi:hypothetical protein [Arthrobacter mobilis]|uniref:hypothetical protein n=1 Tax=Arthrobacter mobilis TaxID=2724944 RepID=UPI0028A5EA06|nr:hypothetical protein [Arthrobacter mobilis]
MPSSAGTTARRCSGCRPAIGLGGRDPAAQLNLEFRAADATGNPWLVMGLLIRAGLEGIRQRLPAPEGLDRPIEEVGEDAQRALKLYEMRRLKGLDGGAKCLRYAGVH